MKRKVTEHIHTLWETRAVAAEHLPWLVADQGAHMIMQLGAGLG